MLILLIDNKSTIQNFQNWRLKLGKTWFQNKNKEILKEILEDTENELEVVRKRLENLDADFRWENAIFNKIVSILKRVRVSP